MSRWFTALSRFNSVHEFVWLILTDSVCFRATLLFVVVSVQWCISSFNLFLWNTALTHCTNSVWFTALTSMHLRFSWLTLIYGNNLIWVIDLTHCMIQLKNCILCTDSDSLNRFSLFQCFDSFWFSATILFIFSWFLSKAVSLQWFTSSFNSFLLTPRFDSFWFGIFLYLM